MPKSQIDHEDSSSDDDDESIADCLFHDPVCHKCEEAIVNRDQLISCAGGCFRRFHKACVQNHIHNNAFSCFVCLLGGNWCFLCKTQIGPADQSETCQISSCKNRFHASCIQNLEEKSDRRFVCAHHYCLTCSIEDRNPTCGAFLACIKCPSAYHKHDRCIPAGTILLNTRWIICTEHKKEACQKKSANVNFCFVCGLGGTLICCESCPCAVHLECYGLQTPPEGHFICSGCENGRKPMYGDIVWAKYGSHRWWPAEIIHPLRVPVNLDKFLGEPGVFIVRFYGSLDYAPVSRRCVYPFQSEDDDEESGGKSKKSEKDKKYLSAVLEARRALLDQQLVQLRDLPSYIPIECNRYASNVSKAMCRKDSEQTVCSCSKKSKNPCGDDECDNRQMFIECHPRRCLAEHSCRNQRFLKKQYAPAVKFMTIDRGFGLRALASVRKGEFVIEYVGEIINKEECKKRLDTIDAEPDRAFYYLELAPDKIIDAGPMGNNSRFVNHSCDANCRTERWLVNNEYRIGLFACREILAGEELTFHYNLVPVNGDSITPCKCGSKNCTGVIGRIVSKNGRNTNGNGNKKQKVVNEKENERL